MRKAALVSLFLVLCAFAASRDGYRSAYRAWRESDPALERDAGPAGAAISPRADKLAASVAAYGSERSGFLKALAAEREVKLGWLETPVEPLADVAKNVTDHLATAAAAVQRNIATFANDTDPGIQQLQAILQTESAALASLNAAISDRQQAFTAVRSAAAATEQARMQVLSQEQEMIAGLKRAAAETDRQSAAWVEYYKTLSEEAKAPPAGPNATAPSTPGTGPLSTPVTPRAPSVTPVPLMRYTGAWTFPSNGLFHGPQPEFIDLVVHEDNGRADGTLFARFRIAPGSKDDPVLRFDFSGEFKNTRNQTFKLETSDAAKGTIELIPGPAFNLLEVNFQTEPKPGKIHQANVVLVKK